MPMKTRFRLIHRGERGKQFYCVDSETGKRSSLKTKDRDAAKQIVLAKNQALWQPSLNLQIDKAYRITGAGQPLFVATKLFKYFLFADRNAHWSRRLASRPRWRNKRLDAVYSP
jgi:hypothetical protein